MAKKKRLLTQAEYDTIATSDEWEIVELPLKKIQDTPGVQRKADLIGAFASGDANALKMLNGELAVFGIDIIVYEKRPKTLKGEGDVNVYHYIVTRTGKVDLPYCLH